MKARLSDAAALTLRMLFRVLSLRGRASGWLREVFFDANLKSFCCPFTSVFAMGLDSVFVFTFLTAFSPIYFGIGLSKFYFSAANLDNLKNS